TLKDRGVEVAEVEGRRQGRKLAFFVEVRGEARAGDPLGAVGFAWTLVGSAVGGALMRTQAEEEGKGNGAVDGLQHRFIQSLPFQPEIEHLDLRHRRRGGKV